MPRTSHKVEQLTAVDLFAGGGGLTVGLKRAGFRVLAAVEIEPNAFATYKANHPEVRAFRQDIRTVDGKSMLDLSPTGTVDLLVGCPPCQGFSSLTSKVRRSDPRNDLVLEMSRLIREIRPRMVMVENVPGLVDKGKSYFQGLLRSLSESGYEFDYDVLQVADYGVPQSRRRLVLIAARKGMAVEFPDPTHARIRTTGRRPWRTVRSVIGRMRRSVLTLQEARALGGPQAFNWHIVRSMAPQNTRRLLRAQPGRSWTKIPKRLRPDCHQDRRAGFSNVYGRMLWSEVSPTITGGCTTLSKGRFGHPEQNRTISVREAALLQTFPMDYIFDTPFMDYACDIIGNALPCDFAEILARQCAKALGGMPS